VLSWLAMGEPARKLATSEEARPVPTFEELWKEIEKLPEGVTGEILEPGVISTMSRPLAKHRRAAGQLYRALGGADEAAGGVGWWIEQEPDVRFGDRTTSPDIAGWRVERCPDPPDGSPILLLPDFCCEVLSPSTERKDRTKKLPLYARSGVEWIWIVDPDLQFVEVFQSVNGHAMLMDSADGQETKRLAPFDLDIDFSRLWLIQTKAEPTTE
jgi:Uma2 family endonuclease